MQLLEDVSLWPYNSQPYHFTCNHTHPFHASNTLLCLVPATPGLGSGGGFERLHYLLDSFFDADGEITPAFIKVLLGGADVTVVAVAGCALCAGMWMGVWSIWGVPAARHLRQAVSLTAACMQGFESWQSWESNPLYALLHEAIYCQGTASRWAGQRVRDEPQFKDVFDATAAVSQGKVAKGLPSGCSLHLWEAGHSMAGKTAS